TQRRTLRRVLRRADQAGGRVRHRDRNLSGPSSSRRAGWPRQHNNNAESGSAFFLLYGPLFPDRAFLYRRFLRGRLFLFDGPLGGGFGSDGRLLDRLFRDLLLGRSLLYRRFGRRPFRCGLLSGLLRRLLGRRFLGRSLARRRLLCRALLRWWRGVDRRPVDVLGGGKASRQRQRGEQIAIAHLDPLGIVIGFPPGGGCVRFAREPQRQRRL